MIPSAKTVKSEVFDVSKLEPKSLYVVFTKRNRRGSEMKMGLLVTMPKEHEHWAEFLLAGAVWSCGEWWRVSSRFVDFANEIFPDYFQLHTAVKLNKEPLSDKNLKLISDHMQWENRQPVDLDEPLQEFLATFLTRVNFILPEKLKAIDKGQLAKNVIKLTEIARLPSIAAISLAMEMNPAEGRRWETIFKENFPCHRWY
ncbi:hypothetical protein DFH11DRAFT_1746061 [Phellopilus nigrolimitatus]|nr:hypothetical protein DFH11DRAFT_1746061 [Phellopilus nigrolimitatus]